MIETKRGEFHWEIIDLALSEAQEHGQTLAIRLMPYSQIAMESYGQEGSRNCGAALAPTLYWKSLSI